MPQTAGQRESPVPGPRHLVDEPFYTRACVAPLLERFGSSVAGAAFPAGFFDWKRLKTTIALYGPFSTAGRMARMALASARGGDVHRLFATRRIPVHDVADVNTNAFLDQLRGLGVDLIVSINTPQRLKKPLLGLPANGCLNVHFGMLPKYRGLLPIFHALMNGESSFGVTVHLMALPQLQNRWRVQAEWFWAYFTGQRGSRLIPEQAQSYEPGRRDPANSRAGV